MLCQNPPGSPMRWRPTTPPADAAKPSPAEDAAAENTAAKDTAAKDTAAIDTASWATAAIGSAGNSMSMIFFA
ncbi:MAG: hypothetical protein R3C99_10800 [Pirellulaceae bacterium]